MSDQPREWVSLRRLHSGGTVVTVTLVDGNLSSRWAATTYLNSIPDTVRECRKYANEALAQMKATA